MKKQIFLAVFLLATMLASARIYLGVPGDELETTYPEGRRQLLLETKPSDRINNFFYDPSSNQLFAAITRGKKEFIESNQFKSKGYNEIINFGFLTAIKEPYYVTKTKERHFVHIGKQMLGPYEGVGSLAASANDDFIAYQVKKANKVAIVYNNVLGTLYDEVGYPSISPSGQYAYRAQQGSQQLLVINGVEHDDYTEYGMYSYGERGEELYYLASNDRGWFILKEGTVISGPFDEIDLLMVSADGKAFIASARQGNERFAIVDGQRKEGYDQIVSITISPEGDSYAYGIIKGDQGGYVVNGVEETLYDDLYFLSFSNDGKNYYYHAKKMVGGF